MRCEYLVVAGAVLLTVIVVRIVWVMAYNAVVAVARSRRFGLQPAAADAAADSRKRRWSFRWCGMRGIVTLAAAFALPDGSTARRSRIAT